MKTILSNFTVISISAVLIFTTITISGCAGRHPQPMQTYQPGDEDKSCARLNSEMENLETEILERFPGASKTGSNVGLGIAGAFLLVPWFFMDFSEADEIEVDALIKRHNHLLLAAQDKGCETDQERIPSIDELQKQAREAAGEQNQPQTY
ncbi:MAG: hypothetical protein AAGB35_09045 [Pseudomonadota bacterium]